MANEAKAGDMVTDLDIFQQLEGQAFTYWGDLIDAVNATVWENFPRFRVSTYFHAEGYTAMAWKKGWISRNDQGEFVVNAS